jgi:hypothetical protein
MTRSAQNLSSKVILATELCGCFIGYEPKKSDVVYLWKKWGNTIQQKTTSEAVADRARAALFCDEHRRAA